MVYVVVGKGDHGWCRLTGRDDALGVLPGAEPHDDIDEVVAGFFLQECWTVVGEVAQDLLDSRSGLSKMDSWCESFG